MQTYSSTVPIQTGVDFFPVGFQHLVTPKLYFSTRRVHHCWNPLLLGNLGRLSTNHFWLLVNLPLWKMMEFVSWDDDIPNMMGNIFKKNVPNHQPDLVSSYSLTWMLKDKRFASLRSLLRWQVPFDSLTRNVDRFSWGILGIAIIVGDTTILLPHVALSENRLHP